MQGIERQLACLTFADDFAVGVCHLFTAITIGLPAAFRTESPTVVVEGVGNREIPTLDTYLDDAVEMAHADGWPPLREISVSNTWDWFSRLPGLGLGIVSSPLGRAVAALSHIIYPESNNVDSSTGLVWALLGLEAIYGRGSTGIGEQLQEKSEVLLGTPNNDQRNKKRISAAYHFRSRFLHGDLNMPFRYTHEFDHKDILKYGNNQWDAALFAVVLLVSTLQEFVQRNTYEMSFSYAVRT